MKITIPYYLHKAGAGFPSPATDYIEEDIDLNVHLIKNVPATFVIRVQGKSMTDVGINVACVEGIDPFELKNIGLNNGENHPLDQKK